jgi:prophage maintenance system killer protein
MNHIEIKASDEAIVKTVSAVAEGKLQKGALADFFRKHARK